MKHRSPKISVLAVAVLMTLFATRPFSAQMTPRVEKRTVAVKGAGYFPVLLRLKTDRLLVVYRYGASHIDVKGQLAISWSDDKGSTWSSPLVVTSGKDDHRNPAMVELPNGDVLLAYCIMDGYDATGRKFMPTIKGVDPRSAKPLWMIRSHDHGATWSAPEEIDGSRALADDGELLNVFGKMTLASDGSILLSTYTTPRDFHETSLRVSASLGLFRAGFVSYMIEAACDLSLTAIFYLLLRPVSRPLSLITAFFGLFATATFAVGEIFYYAAALPQIDAHFAAALSPDARTRFGYLCLRLYGTVFDIFVGVYGAETMLRGYLFFRSGYLSRFLGVLLLLGGAGFIIKNLCVVLAPQYDSMFLVIPMMVAMLAVAIWLPFKGIDRDRLERLQAQDRDNN